MLYSVQSWDCLWLHGRSHWHPKAKDWIGTLTIDDIDI